MPVSVDQFGSYTYQGGSYGDIEFPAEPQDHNAVDQFLGLKSGNEDTYSGGALPSPSTVTVSVLNGSGAYNQATTTSQSLQALGFHIGTIGDSPPVGREAETVVYYASKTPAQLAAAQIGGELAVGRGHHGHGPDPGEGRLTGHCRHGHRLLGQRPARRPRRRPGGCRRASTDARRRRASSGNTGNSGAFQAPTPTVESLQPWDPRSCTASGGEGP